MVVYQPVNKQMFIILSTILPKNNMLSKYIKLLSSYLKIEIDMLVDNLDSEEDIVHQIQEKWLLNGHKNNLEI
jgi:hypothetical protein